MVTTAGTRRDADQVIEIAADGYTDGIDVLACIELLEAGNEREVTASLIDADAMRAYSLARMAIF